MTLHRILPVLSIIFSCTLGAQPFVSIAASSTKLLPSVVKIKIQRTDNPAEESELIQNDSGGSGFVFDNNHHILTNAHVIKDAKKIAVLDINNTEHSATLVAKDDKTDLAVLNVPTLNAPPLPLGNNTQLALGDNVFVIGSPYSLGLGVTVGVVSALQRYLPNYPYQYFIQTDAAINPGNSGGPVFNQHGELIAVASMTFLRAGSYTNIGFAIPINDALRVANLLISQKKINRGYLGADVLISEKVSRKLGFQFSVLITHVAPKSPADLAGLKAGDIIIELNDEKFIDNGALHRFLEHSKPNESIRLTYVRDKKYSKATMSLSATPNITTPISNIGTADTVEKLGLIVQENDGLEILLSFSSAKVSGFASGDKIVQVNTTPISSIKELNTYLSKLKDTEIAMVTLRRMGDEFTLPLGSKAALNGYWTTN